MGSLSAGLSAPEQRGKTERMAFVLL